MFHTINWLFPILRCEGVLNGYNVFQIHYRDLLYVKNGVVNVKYILVLPKIIRILIFILTIKPDSHTLFRLPVLMR